MFTIKKAVRTATPALIGLWSMSGGGKTMSALKLARGLVGPKGKIGVADTENKRALFYADVCGPWDHLDFQPPFTPDRYTQAVESFHKKGGYDCLIVDGMSHVWEGEGGIIDMAEANKKGGLLKWQAPKMAYKRMMNNLLRSPTHVIFCLRAKSGSVQSGSGSNMVITQTGLEPICEKNFIYEMTISVLLGPDHKPLFEDIGRFTCNETIPRVKIPEEIKHVIVPGEFISEKTGEQIREWIAGGADFDKDQARLETVARDVATLGTKALEKHWKSLGKKGQTKLLPIRDEIKSTAAAADKENEVPEEPETSDEAPPIDTSSLDEDPEPDQKPDKKQEPDKEPQFLVHKPNGNTDNLGNISEWKHRIHEIVLNMGSAESMTAFINAHKTTFDNIKAKYPDTIQLISEEISVCIGKFNDQPKEQEDYS